MTELVVAGSTLPPAAMSDDPAPERRHAWWIAGFFFIGILGFAALIPLDSGAYAPGLVAVSGNRQAVQHRDGGVVTRLNVEEGARVAKGQPLIEISATDIAAEERGLTREWLMLVAERARLEAERSGAPRVAPPPEFAGLGPADRPLADEALVTQQALLDARRATVAQQKRVLNQQERQQMERMAGFSAQRSANAEQRRLIEDELAGMKELEAKGFASKNRIRALERTSAGLEGDVGTLTARMSETVEARQQAQMQALVIDRNLIEEVDQRQREVATRLNEIQPALTAVRQKLERATVRAPAEGRVVGLSVFTEGGVVAPGQLLMEIVPENRALVVQARLSPDDGDDVEAGMPVEVRFPTMRDVALPRVFGTLKSVSADLIQDERTGQGYFAAEIVVPADQLEALSAERQGKAPIGAGIPVEVMVKIEDRTALSYLFQPLIRSFWRAGREH
jgi:HlyD family secretion protein